MRLSYLLRFRPVHLLNIQPAQTHEPLLAPSEAILSAFKEGRIDWSGYEQQFIALMHQRGVADQLGSRLFDGACLLCSEDSPAQCHRRLVAEHFQQSWKSVEIVHLR